MQKNIDRSWTLFLDRDGVVNQHRPKDYVKSWDEFTFLPGALDAIRTLTERFGKIIMVTNQHGVPKGVMSQEALDEIHARMLGEIRKNGGDIHCIYSATTLAGSIGDIRKPHPHMAHKAVEDFPEIDLSRALIVGDSLSDMQFGRNADIATVYIGDSETLPQGTRGLIDARFDSLASFAKSL